MHVGTSILTVRNIGKVTENKGFDILGLERACQIGINTCKILCTREVDVQ